MKGLSDRGIAFEDKTYYEAIVYDFPGILSDDEKDSAKDIWE